MTAAQGAGPQRSFGLRPRAVLPRTLLGRAVVIVLTPVLLAQLIATFIFFDRHWSAVTGRLGNAVAGELSMLVIQLESLPPQRHAALIRQYESELGIRVTVTPGQRLGDLPGRPWTTPVGRDANRRLELIAGRPGRTLVHEPGETIEMRLDSNAGLVRAFVPHRRLFTSTGYIFLLWMLGASVVLFAIALIFLRNQIRPIRQLAVAADRFGKGQDMPRFKPAGATEVRQAARAFIAMRERIKRQIAQRTEMLAGVSHDLRTPLTRIRLNLEMAAPDDETPELREIRADLAEMERMIEGYLAFAHGQASEENAPVDLAAVVRTVVAERHLADRVRIDGPAQAEIQGEPTNLRRCIGNLIGNAARYAESLVITIEQRAERLTMTFDDDGPGIPEDEREAVFRPFYRLEDSRNPDTGGVGLGLSVARDIARFHGGEIALEDSPQGGLRAVLTLPR